ncbi:putative DNA mismatch repair protein [Nonlabens ulvanivorans]|uniref:Putative DNA mismatch repair protein n=1 Tax=Nonlabens ulvanivorans TaxID=906888 RepID=A0A090WF16_NONUL|nr:putative DNA mismatch repair protein [Nonlabens ulvanivorans]
MKMSKFQVGDRVLVLDDEFGGVVASAKAEQITIITEDDIEIEYNESELILDQRFKVDRVVVKEEVQIQKGKKRQVSRKKSKEIPAVEVDLHIHQLVKSERGMDAYDKLNTQMDTARYKLEWARKERIPKLVFIHGIGEGVLKKELEFLFDRYSDITYYDADFQKYGRGATEVYIYQNPK